MTTAKQRVQMRATSQRLRAKRKKAGLCPSCGEKPEKGYVCCTVCIEKATANTLRRRRMAKRKAA